MARPSVIPDILLEKMLLKSAEGFNNHEIADWLFSEHQIKVDESNVCRKLKKLKEERQELTKLAYAKAAGKSAVQELKIIDDVITSFAEKITEKLKKDDISAATSLANSMHKYIVTHTAMSALNEDNKENSEENDNLAIILTQIKAAKLNSN